MGWMEDFTFKGHPEKISQLEYVWGRIGIRVSMARKWPPSNLELREQLGLFPLKTT